MKSILVALDQTASARTAQAQAIELAQRFRATLTGIGILDEAAITRPEPVPLGAMSYKIQRDQGLLEREHQLLSELLSDFADLCRASQIEPHLLRLEGNQLEQLEHEATRHDLVVLGRDTSYDPLPAEDGKISKTVEGLLRDNPRPVIVTPPEPLSGDSLLIVYDGRPCSDRLLQVLIMLGLHQDWPVKILGVGDEPVEAEQQARRASEYLEDYGVKAAIVQAPGQSHVEELIMEAAHTCHARLVATTAAPVHGWRRLFGGSSEHRLLKKCSSALLVYH